MTVVPRIVSKKMYTSTKFVLSVFTVYILFFSEKKDIHDQKDVLSTCMGLL